MDRYSYVYYNALINNLDANSDTHHEPHLVFNEDRLSPLITNCEDYDLSIENFKVDLKTLPTFIPTIRYSDDDSESLTRNTTIYEITLECKGYCAKTSVIFTPQDTTNGSEAPPFKKGYPNYRTNYYNLYSFEYFFVMVNEALKTAFVNLKAVLAEFSQNIDLGSDLPYFIFDKDTGLIYLNAPEATFNDDNVDVVNMFLNKPLYRLFNSLPFTRQTDTFISSESIPITQSGFKINISNFGEANKSELSSPQIDGSVKSGVSYLSVYQDYTTLDTWSPVESIVITSNTIPVRTSNTSSTHSYQDGEETVSGSSNIVELELTDFKSGNPIPGIIYTPAYPRWINMRNQNELTNINLELFYRSKLDGSLMPVTICSTGAFSCKLCFRKLM